MKPATMEGAVECTTAPGPSAARQAARRRPYRVFSQPRRLWRGRASGRCQVELLEAVKSSLGELGEVNVRPMFGGSGLLVNERLVALVRDRQLYVRHPGEPAGDEGLCPFPGSRLRLNFRPASLAETQTWLGACRASLDELEELARRVPGRRPFRAYRID